MNKPRLPAYCVVDWPGGAVSPKAVNMILEAGILNVKSGEDSEFETTFKAASPIIAASPGYISHELQRCLEVKGRYLLLVQWEALEDHVVGFRGSPAYQEWRRLLHHFYEPFPTIEHFEKIDLHS